MEPKRGRLRVHNQKHGIVVGRVGAVVIVVVVQVVVIVVHGHYDQDAIKGGEAEHGHSHDQGGDLGRPKLFFVMKKVVDT